MRWSGPLPMWMVPKAVIPPWENPLVPDEVPPPTGPGAPPLPPQPPSKRPRERPADQSRAWFEIARGVRMRELLKWVKRWMGLAWVGEQTSSRVLLARDGVRKRAVVRPGDRVADEHGVPLKRDAGASAAAIGAGRTPTALGDGEHVIADRAARGNDHDRAAETPAARVHAAVIVERSDAPELVSVRAPAGGQGSVQLTGRRSGAGGGFL